MLKTIKSKLIFQASVLLILNIAINSFSMFAMNTLSLGTTKIAEQGLRSVSDSEELQDTFTRYRLSEYKHIIAATTADMQAADQDIIDRTGEINAMITDIKNDVETDDEKQLINSIESDFLTYSKYNKEIFALSREGKQKEAMVIMVGSSRSTYQDVRSLTSQLVDLNKAQAREIASTGQALYNKMLMISIISTTILVLINILLPAIIIISVRRSLRTLKTELDELSSSGGDLTKTIEVKSKDEIKDVADSLNKFIDNLKDIITSVDTKSDDMHSAVTTMKASLNDLNEYIEQISATTEELSATMEETAASAEEMNASSQQIEESIKLIAHKTNQGMTGADTIKDKAIKIKTDVGTSIQKSNEIFTSTKEGLEKAIEASEVVNEISLLSEAIMKIADQTNLLSLNAAIEAARAGDAGKGFSVVANEIRKLADESKTTIESIQEVTKKVIYSVDELKLNSNKILLFMDTDVANDYNTMLSVADDYSNDAKYVKNLVTDIDITAEALSEAINDVIKTIAEVTNAANDGAGGTNDIANRVIELSNKSDNILDEAVKTAENADKLKQDISKFKV